MCVFSHMLLCFSYRVSLVLLVLLVLQVPRELLACPVSVVLLVLLDPRVRRSVLETSISIHCASLEQELPFKLQVSSQYVVISAINENGSNFLFFFSQIG